MTHAERVARLRRRRIPAGPGPGVILLRLALALMFIAVLAVGLVILSAAATVASVYSYFAQDLPDASALEQIQQNDAFETVKIYDRTGQHLLYEVPDPRPFRGDRTYLRIDEIPQVLKDATIALEDRSFYQNPGVDPRGFARALVSTLSGSRVQGGSTIMIQLIKNVLIPPEERA
ncbi:MAG: transglycosylase domain-containing protein, partial [Anaerolineae bacterium]|nr:transglycosylase domain-containing protein [Anaerolineae bacterium]